jgi:hypothetical protein
MREKYLNPTSSSVGFVKGNIAQDLILKNLACTGSAAHHLAGIITAPAANVFWRGALKK